MQVRRVNEVFSHPEMYAHADSHVETDMYMFKHMQRHLACAHTQRHGTDRQTDR